MGGYGIGNGSALALVPFSLKVYLSPLILSLSKDGIGVVRQAHHERVLV